MRKPKHPCGTCLKNVSKCGKAVLCKGRCNKWYHFKCIDMDTEEYQKIGELQMEFVCEQCSSSLEDKGNINKNNVYNNKNEINIEEELKNTTIITNEINKELENEVENLIIMVKTQNEDLCEANKQINELRSHNTQLETLVLQKEEKILILTEKILLLEKQLSNTNSSQNSRGIESSMCNRSLGVQHLRPRTSTSTPIHNNTSLADTQITAYVNKESLFSTVVRKRFSGKNKSPQATYEPEISFISQSRFEPLNTIQNDSNNQNILKIDKSSTSKIGNKVVKEKNKKKILICADSHGKNISWHINKKQKQYEAVGFVRPGGCTEQVLNMENINKEILEKEDVCVIITGTNDVSKNEANTFLTGIRNILNEKNNTKFVVVDVPNRYDLADWSCVNSEVRKANSDLKQLCGEYSNVSLVESSKATRQYHTRQGMHLNVRGKEWLSEKIYEAIVKSTQGGTKDSPPKLKPSTSSTRVVNHTDLGNVTATRSKNPT